MALTGILTCALLLIFCIRAWRKYPQLLLIVGIFFISYALVANIIRIGTIFGERLFYWPSAFVLMLVAWALVALYRKVIAEIPVSISRTRLATAAWALLAIPMVLMCIRTYRRNTDWSDNVTLAIQTAQDNPGSSKACAWAGGILIIQDQRPGLCPVWQGIARPCHGTGPLLPGCSLGTRQVLRPQQGPAALRH